MNYLIQFLSWLIITGVLDEVHLDFMIAGHTKFYPDACFGCLKRKAIREQILDWDDFHRVVENSAECNLAVNTRDASFRTYNWKAFLTQFFRKVPNISKLHCLDICRDGVTAYEIHGDGKPKIHSLLRTGITEAHTRNPSEYSLQLLDNFDTSDEVGLLHERVEVK